MNQKNSQLTVIDTHDIFAPSVTKTKLFLQSLVLSKNSTAVKWWTTPPLDPELRIHIFNYTNADRYMRGLDAKLKVEDLGPYTYIEKFEKVNVTFNGNYTISYRVSEI